MCVFVCVFVFFVYEVWNVCWYFLYFVFKFVVIDYFKKIYFLIFLVDYIVYFYFLGDGKNFGVDYFFICLLSSLYLK